MDYAELVKQLRNRRVCIQNGGSDRDFHLWGDAADAIELLDKLYHSAEDDHETMRNAYIAEVEKHRWIPVTERLPEKAGIYIICDHYGNVMSRHFCKSHGKFAGYWHFNGSAKYGNPTHWMPLPRPPEDA